MQPDTGSFYSVASSFHQNRKSRCLQISDDWRRLFGNYEEFPVSLIHLEVPLKNFATGSSYVGSWCAIGMSGFGTYTFPHNVEYEGYFKDNEFNNDGTLLYRMGQKLYGHWENGNLLTWTYRFRDGLEFNHSWAYCVYPDRRFSTTLQDGLKPAGRENLTNDVPPRPIPEGCYDVGEGFYSLQNKCIISALDENKIIRIPDKEEEKWIIKNCRKAWDEPTGYRPDLYENWTTGRRESTTNILKKIKPVKDEIAGEASDIN